MDWNAAWIWHPAEAAQSSCYHPDNGGRRPDREKMDNFYMLARRAFSLDSVPPDARVFVTASSLYKLYVNDRYVGRGPNPSDPSRYYYDVHDVTSFLREGENVLAAVCYNYGEKAHGVLGQNWGRGGFLLELRAPGSDGEVIVATDGSWRVRRSPEWDPDAPVNCTLLGDFKETYDSRLEIAGWMEPGFDDPDWVEPEVLGKPPVAPWTSLVEREIPFLGGERVHPVNVTWESASVTYAWREDWEVYDEQTLVPDGPHGRRAPSQTAGRRNVARVFKTHDDFSPSIILDFGRDVTGYPEIHVKKSAGGVIDVLYGEDLFLVRVDRFILKGGPQVLGPFNRRTFRYMKLLFVETGPFELCSTDEHARGSVVLAGGGGGGGAPLPNIQQPVEIAEVSMKMDTYPVERAGSFTCSDELLNRIWEVGAYTMRMCMLDHFVDCPWRERTLYGGDLYAENLIAHYAFGDPRMNRKCLRQAFAIQFPEGPLPPAGPYSGFPGFYPSWSALFGLGFTDHYRLTGDAEFLDELWPNLAKLLDWAIRQMETDELGLIGSPEGRLGFDEWMRAEKVGYEPWQNFPFYRLLRESAELARMTGRADEAKRYDAAAERMSLALERHMVDPESGAVQPAGRGRITAGVSRQHQSGQYDNTLILWSGIPGAARGRDIALALFSPETGRIRAPFHGLFVTEGLFAYREDLRAVDFIRRYWGGMLSGGATTFWDNFSLDWPPGVLPDRQTSLCHGWAAGPTYSLSAQVLGVRPLEPGFRRVLVEPRTADLEWAAGTVPTPRGPVSLNWQRSAGRFRLEVDVPEGSAARVSLPPVNAPRPRVTLEGEAIEAGREGPRRVIDVEAGRHVLEHV